MVGAWPDKSGSNLLTDERETSGVEMRRVCFGKSREVWMLMIKT